MPRQISFDLINTRWQRPLNSFLIASSSPAQGLDFTPIFLPIRKCTHPSHTVWSTSLPLPTCLGIYTSKLRLSMTLMQYNEFQLFWNCHPCAAFEQQLDESIWEDCFCTSRLIESYYHTERIFCTLQLRDRILKLSNTSSQLPSTFLLPRIFSLASRTSY